MNDPTPGALRAAKQLFPDGHNNWRGNLEGILQDQLWNAAIIDRETRAPQLEAALRDLLEAQRRHYRAQFYLGPNDPAVIAAERLLSASRSGET